MDYTPGAAPWAPPLVVEHLPQAEALYDSLNCEETCLGGGGPFDDHNRWRPGVLKGEFMRRLCDALALAYMEGKEVGRKFGYDAGKADALDNIVMLAATDAAEKTRADEE